LLDFLNSAAVQLEHEDSKKGNRMHSRSIGSNDEIVMRSMDSQKILASEDGSQYFIFPGELYEQKMIKETFLHLEEKISTVIGVKNIELREI